MVKNKCLFCIFYKRTVFLMLHKSGCFCAYLSGYKRKKKKCKNQNIFLGCNIELSDGTVTDRPRSLQGGCVCRCCSSL